MRPPRGLLITAVRVPCQAFFYELREVGVSKRVDVAEAITGRDAEVKNRRGWSEVLRNNGGTQPRRQARLTSDTFAINKLA